MNDRLLKKNRTHRNYDESGVEPEIQSRLLVKSHERHEVKP
jgi:hypothetical protein